MSELKIYKMNDKSDSFTTKKKIIFDIAFRLIITGKTGTGKTSALGSLLLLPQFYKNDFKGDNIYIFSALVNDFKMEQIIKSKKIPEMNIFTGFDDELLNALYDKLVEEAKEDVARKKKIRNTLIILDDVSFDGSLRNGLYNAVSRVFMNGRKQNISIIITAQYFSHILPSVRANASGAILYNTNDKQLDLINDDYNFINVEKGSNKSMFKKMFRDNVKEIHDFIVVNFSNKRDELYLNKDFKPINI